VRRRLVTLLAVVAVVAAACAGGGGDSSDTTTSIVATTTTTVPRQDAYAVGRRSMELVDLSRPTAADANRDLPEHPDRTIEVLLLYPAAGDVPDATKPLDRVPVADGTFPLVVFAHGWKASGPAFEARLKEWARAGYVVAAPTFPLSSGRGAGLGDYVNQPDDVSFVIDELLALDDDDPLAAHIDAESIAVAGHSLGAMTVLGLALNTCCTDDRIDAVVELSGLRLPFGTGDYDLDAVPWLGIHGAKDRTVNVSGSDSLFADAPGPAYYLRLDEGDHSGYVFLEGELVDDVVLAFLDRYLYGEEDALDDVPAVVEAHGDATFEVKPAA
jgi:dienelactone hydrolase